MAEKLISPELLVKHIDLMLSFFDMKAGHPMGKPIQEPGTDSKRFSNIMAQRDGDLSGLIGLVESHFLDSGSFTLWSKAAEYAKENQKGQWDYYDTQEFWDYVDAYAEFVKKYQAGIDFYANVDAIPNPELTWRNQRYLEKTHQLKPIPVVHYKTDLKWLHHYIDKGYDYIALGGLVGSTATDSCRQWLDRAFTIVCDAPKNLPKVKIHGFGVTTHYMLLRYPWWSVDSSTWSTIGSYGGIPVPKKRKGKFDFSEPPIVIKVSQGEKARTDGGQHFLALSKSEQSLVSEWLELIGLPLGKNAKDGTEIEPGVINQHALRRAAGLLYFEHLRQSLPEWPWPFKKIAPKGFFS